MTGRRPLLAALSIAGHAHPQSWPYTRCLPNHNREERKGRRKKAEGRKRPASALLPSSFFLLPFCLLDTAACSFYALSVNNRAFAPKFTFRDFCCRATPRFELLSQV